MSNTVIKKLQLIGNLDDSLTNLLQYLESLQLKYKKRGYWDLQIISNKDGELILYGTTKYCEHDLENYLGCPICNENFSREY